MLLYNKTWCIMLWILVFFNSASNDKVNVIIKDFNFLQIYFSIVLDFYGSISKFIFTTFQLLNDKKGKYKVTKKEWAERKVSTNYISVTKKPILVLTSFFFFKREEFNEGDFSLEPCSERYIKVIKPFHFIWILIKRCFEQEMRLLMFVWYFSLLFSSEKKLRFEFLDSKKSTPNFWITKWYWKMFQ